jgi:hypothetical protein
VVLGREESYLISSDHTLARCTPGDTPVLALGGTVGHEHWWPSPGPFEITTVDGSAAGNADAGGVNVGGAGGTGC